jgi:putative MATE family efflux protein
MRIESGNEPRPPAAAAVPAAPGTSVLRDVLRLAWPAMMQAAMETMVFFADRLMLGRHDTDEVAALVPGGSILWSLSAIFGVWTVGTLAVVARDMGAGKPDAAKRHAVTSMAMALGIGAVAGAVGILLAGPLVSFFGVEARVAAGGRDYLVILLATLPLQFLGLTLMIVYTAAGNTFTPMAVSVGSNLLNILGNWCLIYGNLGFPEMGIRGAAISSTVSFSLFGLSLALLLFRRRSPIPLRFADLKAFSRESAARMMRVSVPAAVERVIFHAGFVGFARIVTALGTASMAAHEILIAIQSAVFIPGEGFGIAAGSIMGRRLGAGRPEEALRAAKISTWLVSVSLVAIGIVFILLPGPLIGLFTTDWAIVAIGVPPLIVGAFEGFFLGVFQVLSGGIRGAGDTRTPMIATTVGIWIVRLPACALLGLPPEKTFGLGLDLGLLGVWLGTFLDWVTRAAIVTIAFNRGRWKTMKV